MKNKLVLSGVLTVLLAAGLVLAGCDDGGGGAATLTITGIPDAQMDARGFSAGLFVPDTPDTEIKNAYISQNVPSSLVAGGSSDEEGEVIRKKGSKDNNTVIVLLRDAATGFKLGWNGEPGVYDIWIVVRLESSTVYLKAANQLVLGSKTISASKFEIIP
jgi:hypothetical protein